MEDPLYSVVVPTYNRAALLGEALDSILAQEGPKLEILVVDDGSTDDTARLAGAYGDRIVYLHQERQGPAAARNLGVARARGDWIAVLDSDDLWLPGKAAAELALFTSHPELDALITDCEIWTGGELVRSSHFAVAGVEIPAEREIALAAELPPLWVAGSLFATGALVLRRRALGRLGLPPFDPTLTHGEDWDFEIRLYHRATVGFAPQSFTRVRRVDDGTRGERGMPGGGGSPAQQRAYWQIRDRILERASELPELTETARRAVEEERRRIGKRLGLHPL
jgi:glycosyltransferase involved in cell wall biosynthesis